MVEREATDNSPMALAAQAAEKALSDAGATGLCDEIDTLCVTRLFSDMGHLWREAILYDPSRNKIKLYWAGENRLNPPWRVERRA